MYYFRDSYFDQEVAYGIARSVQIRRFNQRSTGQRVLNNIMEAVSSLTFLVFMFAIAYMVLDVLGLNHLMEFYAGQRLAYKLGLGLDFIRGIGF